MKRGWMVAISDKRSFKGLSPIMPRFCLVWFQFLSEFIWKSLLHSRRDEMWEGIWDIQSFFLHPQMLWWKQRIVLSWHFVLISDRDLWLPSPVTLPLWRSRCPHFRVDWAHAGHTIVYRFPLSIQLCWTCAAHTVVFGSSRTMALEWGVYTIVFGRAGVHITPMLKCPRWVQWYAVYSNKDTCPIM